MTEDKFKTDEEKQKRIDELIGEVERGEYKRATIPNHGEKRNPDYEKFEEYSELQVDAQLLMPESNASQQPTQDAHEQPMIMPPEL